VPRLQRMRCPMPACAPSRLTSISTLPTPWRCSSVADAAAVAAASAAQAARRREGAQLEAALSGRLDPIDWATYEPYLYANKQRAGARSQVRACASGWCLRFLSASGHRSAN